MTLTVTLLNAYDAQLHDDLRDAMEDGNEISELLSRDIGGGVVDDVDIDDELAQLQDEVMAESLLGAPEAPTGVPAAGKRVLPRTSDVG